MSKSRENTRLVSAQVDCEDIFRSDVESNGVQDLLSNLSCSVRSDTKNPIYDDSRFAIHEAAKNNHEKVLKSLLDKFPNKVNVVNRKQETALHIAARFGQVEATIGLTNYPSIDVNCLNNEGISPLHMSVGNGDLDVTAVLLQHRQINVDLKTKAGDSPLLIAVESGIPAMVALLLFCKADQNVGDQMGFTPLTRAAINNFSITAEILRENSLSSDASFIYSKTLTLVCKSDCPEAVSLVIGHIIKENKLTEERFDQALNWSFDWNHLDLSKWLVESMIETGYQEFQRIEKRLK